MVANLDIREHAALKHIRLWRIADRMGMADCTLSKRMRREMPIADKQRVRAIIDELAAEDAAAREVRS